MGRFVLIVLGVYLLYYAVNIIYDLYIKKEKVEDSEEEVITLDGIDTEENISNIEIDDVEEMNMPQNFSNEEMYATDEDTDDERTVKDISKLKNKYQEELELDQITQGKKTEEKVENLEIKNEENSKTKKGFRKLPTPLDVQNILKQASSKIFIVGVEDGYACYNLK